MARRLYDGKEWVDIPEVDSQKPPPPAPDGDGTIFVSVVSYRDGERCGETLKSIFENAKDASKVIVGLVENNAPDDAFCLEEYCKSYGSTSLKRSKVRKDVTKIVTNPKDREACPHYDQVRHVAFHHINAKGPMLSRAMARKALGNEEFCMQVDAHTVFVQGWDEIAKEEWKMANNEFAVISTAPAPKSAMDDFLAGDKARSVPRQCSVTWRENGFPDFSSPADSIVTDMEEPLLAHAWSAGFSFAKCHLEESAPYDPFAWFAMPIEQFSRYARFWTRGYDVYTPTRNIVFHDYGPQANGHGNNEWFQRQRDRFRKEAIARVQTALGFPGGDDSPTAKANLGLYGVGKRRSIQQLLEFTKLGVSPKSNNKGESSDCVGHSWVPFDPNISPTENLFDKPDNLDPQPEYPLRTKNVFYQQIENGIPMPKLKIDLSGGTAEIRDERHMAEAAPASPDEMLASSLPPFSLIIVLWVFGLVVWCAMFMNPMAQPSVKTAIKKRRKQAVAKDM